MKKNYKKQVNLRYYGPQMVNIYYLTKDIMKIIQDKVILDRIKYYILILKLILLKNFQLMKDLYIMFNGHLHQKNLYYYLDLCHLEQ